MSPLQRKAKEQRRLMETWRLSGSTWLQNLAVRSIFIFSGVPSGSKLVDVPHRMDMSHHLLGGWWHILLVSYFGADPAANIPQQSGIKLTLNNRRTSCALAIEKPKRNASITGTVFAPVDDAFDKNPGDLEKSLGVASVFVIP
eukprot:scaffold108547_cov14-Tisochrysis_lutea.AAC.1